MNTNYVDYYSSFKSIHDLAIKAYSTASSTKVAKALIDEVTEHTE